MIDTVDLEKKIRDSEDFDEELINSNKHPSIHILLNKYIVEKGVSHADIIRLLNVDRSYGYQLLNGRRMPTRKQLIKICLILRLDFSQTQQLLKTGGKAVLYAKDVIDARVIYSIDRELDYDAACDFIWRKKEND